MFSHSECFQHLDKMLVLKSAFLVLKVKDSERQGQFYSWRGSEVEQQLQYLGHKGYGEQETSDSEKRKANIIMFFAFY